VKGLQAVADPDAVLDAAVFGKLGLEGLELGAHDEPARIENTTEGGIELVTDQPVYCAEVRKGTDFI
jgi:hypothetical protein